MLRAYDWPGNIRELQNVIEWAVLMCEGGTLLPEHLPPHFQRLGGETASADTPDPNTLYGQERALILQVMQQQNWNQSRAARALGVSRDHLRHRLKKYGLHKPA
jgi:DNA-binding NtrC family response regulator